MGESGPAVENSGSESIGASDSCGGSSSDHKGCTNFAAAALDDDGVANNTSSAKNPKTTAADGVLNKTESDDKYGRNDVNESDYSNSADGEEEGLDGDEGQRPSGSDEGTGSEGVSGAVKGFVRREGKELGGATAPDEELPGAPALGLTALHAAAWNGEVQVVSVLLKGGCSVQMRDQASSPPLAFIFHHLRNFGLTLIFLSLHLLVR